MKPADPASNPADDAESLRPAIAWIRKTRAQEELLRAVAGRVKRKRIRQTVTAGICGIAILAAAVTFRSLHPAPIATTGAKTAVATATITRPAMERLPDGSLVELKDDARIEADFDGESRRVRLVRGEAHFQVAHGDRRPFLVQAGAVEVRAVGTAFSVQFAPAAIDVVVTEGVVRVRSDAANTIAAPSVAEVTAGRRCVVDGADAVPRVRDIAPAETDERLAWRVPQLEFSRTPLPEVVTLMNENAPRTGGIRIEIADADLNAIKLTGFLRADNTEGLVRLLETNFRATAERSSAKILLRKNPSPR